MNKYQKDLIIRRLEYDGSHDYYEYVPALNIVFEILGYKERILYDRNGARFVDEESTLYTQSNEGLLI